VSCTAAGVLASLLSAAGAEAQAVERAYEHYGRADFGAAVEVLERALAGDGMTLDEVTEAFELLTLCRLGTGDDAGAET
jgi:hypothetical protein